MRKRCVCRAFGTLYRSRRMSSPPDTPRPDLAHIIADELSTRRSRIVTRWVVAGLLVVGGVVAAVVMRPQPVAAAERFRAEAVTRGPVIHEVTATGHLEARGTVTVGAEISGKIASVEVDFNARVTKGQVLARFDRTSLLAQDQQAHAGLEVARTAMREAELAAAQAERDRKRVEALFASNAVSAAERDAAVDRATQATAHVANMKAQAALQRASGSLADTNLARADIVSPIDGVVIKRAVEPGQTVAAAFQAPELFVLAEDLKKMRVVAAIDEADIGQVRVGQAARFTVDAFPDRTFEAEVTEVRNAPVVTQNVVTYETLLSVENPDLELRPGMTASLRIVTAEEKDAVLVPNAALRFTPPGQEASRGKRRGVFVLAPGGEPQFVEVTPGLTDGVRTAVRGELAPDVQVLVDLAPTRKNDKGG